MTGAATSTGSIRAPTGDERSVIEARIGGTAGLLNMTAAQEAMREAAKAAWLDERRTEQERARPATGIETKIAAALKSTMTGTEFAAALDQAGLTITRATETDVAAVDALREQEGFDRVSGIARRQCHFASVKAGDFAAVTRTGDVFRLNPHRLDFEEIEQRLADTEPRMPGVVEARARAEIKRDQTAELWAQRRAENLRAAAERSEKWDAERNRRALKGRIKHTVRETLADA